MWSEILVGYGIFILEVLTLILVIGGVVMAIFALKQQKSAEHGELQIVDLAEQYQHNVEKLRDFQFTEAEFKQLEKQRKKAEKEKVKIEKEKLKKGESVSENKATLYVLNFKGDMSASETSALREEINAILAVANAERDEVLVRLESPGGVVHGYGLAASQLARLKHAGIKLTVAVDKVAASGGYMMACVADKIVSAPFAIIGSVGVVAQLPNIHRLLKKHDIDVDVMTAGEYKRTVTVLGENTERGKQKFQQELEETHELFKQFVSEHRPNLEIEKIATGEHWFGKQALSLNLVDEIATSDDVILQAIKEKSVIGLSYKQKKSLVQKLGKQTEESAVNILLHLIKGDQRRFL